MKPAVLALKCLVLCSILFSISVQGLSAGTISTKEGRFNQKITLALADTSRMFYYSFQHHKTIKYEDILSNADMSFIQTCVGRELVLTAPNYGEAAKYSWEGPNGFRSQQAKLKFDEVQLKHDGIYRVTVTKGNLTVLGKIKLVVHPMPIAKVNKSIFMEDQAIQLEAVDIMLDAQYIWRAMDRKVISKSKDLWISPKKKGTYNYFLTVNKDGCEVSKKFKITVGTEDSKPLYKNTVDVLRHSYR